MTFDECVSKVINGERSAIGPDPRNFQPDALESFTEFGIHFHSSTSLTKEQIDRRFSEVRRWMQQSVDSVRPNAVYVDTTTLYTVEQVIRGEFRSVYLTPETLLDLATF